MGLQALVCLSTISAQLATDIDCFRGCVTPQVIQNVTEYIDGDMEMIDGFEDIPEADQDKVRRAIDQGHVDDEDWRGVSRIADIQSRSKC